MLREAHMVAAALCSRAVQWPQRTAVLCALCERWVGRTWHVQAHEPAHALGLAHGGDLRQHSTAQQGR